MKTSKSALCHALRVFIAQRSGIDFRDYGERDAFMGDYRPILKEGRHARVLLRAVELRDAISADDLIESSKRAFSGRLTFKLRPDGSASVDYCTGQYFPTEYRAAACAVLASVMWHYFRSNMPAAQGTIKQTIGKGPFAHEQEFDSYDGLSAGDWIRKQARNEFGRAIARDWFN